MSSEGLVEKFQKGTKLLSLVAGDARNLSKQGYVRGSGSAVVAELLAEAILEEPVFDLYADLAANDEDDHSDGEEHRGRDHEGGGENQAQHRRINRMTDDAI